MKVNKVVGWLTGQNGTGNVFELEKDGKFVLAMIWQDGKFHYLGANDLASHIGKGKAEISTPVSRYVVSNTFPENADGSFTVENPVGWQRLFVAPGSQEPGEEGEETTTEDQLVFPFSISFSGEIKVTLGGISKLFKLIE